MASDTFEITFWQPTEAVAAIARATGNLTNNTEPAQSDIIGSYVEVAGTATATSGNDTVTKDSGPDFTANAQVGDVMAAYDGVEWILVGTVEAVAASTITLVAGAANTVTALAYAFSRGKIRQNQNIYVRIKTLIGAGSNSNTRKLPYLRAFRTPNSGDPTIYCDTSIINLTQFSETNDPNSNPGSANVIQCQVTRTTTFAPGTAGTAFANTNQFPLYVWYLLNPFGSQDTLLTSNTRFNILFSDTLEYYEVYQNIPSIYYSQVASYGYF